MKLPEEVLAAMRIKPDGVTPFTDLFAEAIVRDCAKVCQPLTSELLLHCGEMDRREIRAVTAALTYVANKMKARYGLTEKEPK